MSLEIADTCVYAIVLTWTNHKKLSLGHVKAHTGKTVIELLCHKERLSYHSGSTRETVVTFPTLTPKEMSTLKWVWGLKIT